MDSAKRGHVKAYFPANATCCQPQDFRFLPRKVIALMCDVPRTCTSPQRAFRIQTGKDRIAIFSCVCYCWGCDAQASTPCGTSHYMAPEIVGEYRHSLSVDLWYARLGLGIFPETIFKRFWTRHRKQLSKSSRPSAVFKQHLSGKNTLNPWERVQTPPQYSLPESLGRSCLSMDFPAP